MHNFAEGVADGAESGLNSATLPQVQEQTSDRVSPRRAGLYVLSSAVLPRHHFLEHLQLEKRRSDRSKAPLSVVLFSFQTATGNSGAKKLLDYLRTSKRETDILGLLGDGQIALLLPDTSSQGAQGFTRNLANRADQLLFSTVTGTYPDQVFDGLTRSHARDSLEPLQLLVDDAENGLGLTANLKRAVDILGSVIALLLLAPVMALAASAVLLTSPGPVIFKQMRLGRRGKPFVFYKFRSMRCGSDDQIHRDYVTKLISGNNDQVNQGDAAQPWFKIKSDPRVTRVGAWLRKTSLDELPQLLNVLKGDMSLVGPRPPLPYEAEKYQAWHLRRVLEIKPGITGLWQVEGRSRTSFDDMVRLDLRYTQDQSLWLDMKILAKTVRVVISREGAT